VSALLSVSAPAASAAEPTQQELHFLYEVNRARSDPAGWAIEYGLDSILGGDGQYVTLTSVAPKPPLALNAALVDSARFKAQELADFNYFAHQSQVAPDSRVAREGAREEDHGRSGDRAGERIPQPVDPGPAFREDQALPTQAHAPGQGQRRHAPVEPKGEPHEPLRTRRRREGGRGGFQEFPFVDATPGTGRFALGWTCASPEGSSRFFWSPRILAPWLCRSVSPPRAIRTTTPGDEPREWR